MTRLFIRLDEQSKQAVVKAATDQDITISMMVLSLLAEKGVPVRLTGHRLRYNYTSFNETIKERSLTNEKHK